MLQNQPAVFIENIFFEDQIGQFPRVAHAERRVGKDDVESSVAIFDVMESITAYGMHHFGKMFFRKLFYKLNASCVIIHASNAGTSARKKLVGYISRSAKKVQDFYHGKIKMVIQNIEERGFG